MNKGDGYNRDFLWLIERLTPNLAEKEYGKKRASSFIHGCELLFSEIAVFVKGNIKFVSYINDEGFMEINYDYDQNDLHHLRLFLTKKIKTR